MNAIWQIFISMGIPGLGLCFLGLIQRYFPKENLPLQTAISLTAAVGWCCIGGVTLCSTGLVNKWAIIIWVFGGAAAALRIGGKPAMKGLSWLALTPGLLLIPYLLMALVPPWYRDSMTYHLALPKIFGAEGGYAPTDQILFQHFPIAWESFLTLLYGFGDGTEPIFNPRLAGVWLSGGLALAGAGLCRQLGGAAVQAFFVGALILLVPTQIEFGTSAYVQVWLSLLAITALSGIVMGNNSGAVLAGMAAGMAASSKYSGLFVCLLAGILLLKEDQRRRRFCGWAITFGAFFYIRNFIEKGNPVFPLAYSFFGGEGWDSWRAMAYSVTLDDYGMGREIKDWLMLPWRVFTTTELYPFDMDNYRIQGFQGSLGPAIGIAFLWGFLNRKDKARRACLFFVGGWMILWATQVQQIRFLMPAVPIMIALGFAGFKSKKPGLLLLTTAAIWLTAPGMTKSPGKQAQSKSLIGEFWDRQRTSMFISGELGKEELLSQMMPTNYPIYQKMREENIDKLWLVWMREYVYHLPADFRVDSVFGAWRWEKWLDEYETTEICKRLKEDEISHMLINRRFFLVDKNAELTEGRTARLQQKFNSLLESECLVKKKEFGHVMLYSISSD